MSGDSVTYYRRRLAEELSATERADCARAAEAHRELANIYRRLLEEEGGTASPTIVPNEREAEARAG